MSKGISTQQRQILGTAVAISRLRNGAPVARTPQPHRDFRVPVVVGVWPDVSTYIAAHMVGGVGLRRNGRWESLLETIPAALAARSSISRAISSLLKRGLLAYRPYVRGDYDKFGRTDSCYALTAAGLSLGLPHEPAVPDLALRLWLMDRNYKKAWWHETNPITQAYRDLGADETWQAPTFLSAPGRAVPKEHQGRRTRRTRPYPLPPSWVPPARPRPVIDLQILPSFDAYVSEQHGLPSIAERIRALAAQNDPDVLCAGLAAVAAELDAPPVSP